MRRTILLCAICGFTAVFGSPTHASPFGTWVDIFALFDIETAGGHGQSSASASGSGSILGLAGDYSYMAEVDYTGPTFLPMLRAKSTNTGRFDDSATRASTIAYQTYTSTADQNVNLDIKLHAVVDALDGDFTSERTTRARSFISVYGDPDFRVSSDNCGQRLFDGLSMCGRQFGASSLEIFDPDNVTDVTDSINFTVGAGDVFGIYASLGATSVNGSSNAFDTLALRFSDDTFIRVVEAPGAAVSVSLSAAAWLMLIGLLPLLTNARSSFARQG